MRTGLLASAPIALAACLAAAPAASAASLLSTPVAAGSAVARTCHDRLQSAGTAGTVQRVLTMPAAGLVGAKLTAASGDWDVAMFDRSTGRVVAASEGFGATEVAEGFLGGGRAFTVQACRRSGSAASAQLSVFAQAVPAGTSAQKPSLVEVRTPTPAAKDALQTLGLDVTEDAGAESVDVVAYGASELDKLRQAGLSYQVKVDDLVAQTRADFAADRAFRARTASSALPSGSTGYRHLWDYEAEMKALVAAAPELVKPITLPHPTLEGRAVQGIEITSDVDRADGKPVFLQIGLHHAREWPSGEHAMEWAFELVRGYGRDARVTDLVDRVRTIVVPVQNPDGFNLTREAPVDLVEDPQYESLPPASQTATYLADPAFAYKRRNCRVVPGQDAPGGICALPAFRTAGVDTNRNYGGLWGGPGASALPVYDTYRGAGPFSEPESQNIRELISSRQVTTLITNHTFSGLVLRPPGVRAQGPPPDEAAYADLGARMAAQNGYTNEPSYQLYDTTGTTEDWSYNATGGFGFTFEIGPDRFHPAYERTIGEYEGHDEHAGQGNRAAYFIAMENAADAARHSTLAGSAPAGSKLRLTKEFVTETSPVRPAETDAVDVDGQPEGPVQTFVDKLDTTMTVPASGTFEWAINPSTRPIVKGRTLPTVADAPSREQTFHNQTQTQPNQVAGEGADGTYEDVPLSVTDADATKVLAIDLTADSPADDYDLELYRRDGDQLVQVGSSGNVANPESIFLDDPAVGDYVLRVVNYTAVGPWTATAKWFQAGPDQIVPGKTEAWNLTCERPDGVTVSRKLEIERGERRQLDACSAQ
jgi:Zinc carboxypeptidase